MYRVLGTSEAMCASSCFLVDSIISQALYPVYPTVTSHKKRYDAAFFVLKRR